MKYNILLDHENLKNYQNYYLPKENSHIKKLPNFNLINIFIGSNNSGKSRFLRTILKQEKILANNEDTDTIINEIEEHNELIKNLNIDWKFNHGYINANGTPPTVNRNQHIRLKSIPNKEAFFLKDEVKDTIEYNIYTLNVVNELRNIPNFGNSYSYYNNRTTNQRISDPDIMIIKKYEKILEKIKESTTLIELGNNTNYYIPTLRSAHSLFGKTAEKDVKYTKIKEDIFKSTLTKNYKFEESITNQAYSDEQNIEKSEKVNKRQIFLITGLNLYNDIINARNGRKEQRKRFNDFEKFIGKYFFSDENIDIVASFSTKEESENEGLINIYLNGDSRNLYELGDGVQSLITLMYGIFIAPDDTLIFIDEPELNLHPGMQRLFLEQITNNKDLTDKNLRYIIVTHSNHFLDLMLEKDDISIFSFSSKNESLEDSKKESKFLIKNVNAGDNELLRNLGVNNSSVFLANSSIWVEGISDRNYIKAFLHAYCNNQDKLLLLPKEDIDFAFLEYAGSNLEHYDFTSKPEKEKINAFALNNKIFILSDKDSGKEEKHEIFKKIANGRDNIVYKTTDKYREIENLLSIEVWKKTLDRYYSKKIKSEKRISEFQNKLNQKLDNIDPEDFKDKYIGEFLSEIKKEVKDLRKIWNGEDIPKTLNIKAEFSCKILQMTLEGELTWNDFSKNSRVRELTEEIYNFIKSQS